MGDHNLAMFTHAMDYFKKCVNMKKLIPKLFFTSLLSNLSKEDLVTFGNLLSIEFMNPIYDCMQLQASEPRCHQN